jgi:hypothetical protein
MQPSADSRIAEITADLQAVADPASRPDVPGTVQ